LGFWERTSGQEKVSEAYVFSRKRGVCIKEQWACGGEAAEKRKAQYEVLRFEGAHRKRVTKRGTGGEISFGA